MRACIINVFDPNAYLLCENLLESGEEVIALDEREVSDFTSYEEEMWLSVGRNANFMYYPKEQFLLKSKLNQIKALFYFHKEHLSRGNKKQDEKVIQQIIKSSKDAKVYLIHTSEEDHASFWEDNWTKYLVKGKDEWLNTMTEILGTMEEE